MFFGRSHHCRIILSVSIIGVGVVVAAAAAVVDITADSAAVCEKLLGWDSSSSLDN